MIKRAIGCVAVGVMTIGAVGAFGAFGPFSATPAFAAKTIDPAGVYTIHSPGDTDDGCQLTLTDGATLGTGTVSDSCLGTGKFTVSGKTIACSMDKGIVVTVGTLKKKSISTEKHPGAIADGTSGPFDWYATRN
jgi:hypothetical protein